MAGDKDNAADRWRNLVRERLAEMERLSPGRGTVGARFWDSRARRYAVRVTVDDAAGDPFLRRLRQRRGRQGTFLDVGAGTGRFTVHLAAHGTRVTAVDPSPAMIRILRSQVAERGVSDLVRTVVGRWEDVDVEPADVAFSSYVLPVLEDASAFLTKLSRAARRDAYLYLGAFSMDAIIDPLWRHFHGAPRRPGPSYLDAVALLHEVGVIPEVEVVEVANRSRFDTVAEAAKEYADYLLLPEGRQVRRELEGLLASWLVTRQGRLAPPLRFVPAAIIRWPGTAD